MFDVSQLEPLPINYQGVVPEEYIDPMGHLNMRWYMAYFDEAFWDFFPKVGLALPYFQVEKAGAFALRQFIRFLAEVHAGERFSVRTRFIGRSAKRYHYIQFMVNETRNNLAATFEGLGSHVDMNVRRSSPFPAEIAGRMDAVIAEHGRLEWEPPICGFLSV